MPGIAGVISRRPQSECRQDVRAMMQAMVHEPEYARGTHADADMGIYVGWTSHRGSYCDQMPVSHAGGALQLFLAGELFGEQGGRHGDAQGPPVQQVLRWYESKELDFLPRLNGWFHGLLLDRRSRILHLFNDRYGMQRLYYHEEKEGFLFASEAKALLAARPRLRAWDEQGLGEFLSCDCVLEDRTLFRGIRAMPGGSVWSFPPESPPRRKTYFRLQEWEGQDPLEPQRLLNELREIVPQAMGRQVRSDLPVAISLTGGLDTRLLMAVLAKPDRPLPCYTFGGMYRESLDVSLARAVAEACGQPYQVLPLGEDYLARFPALTERSVYLSEGGLSASGSYELHLNRIAARIGKVRLTGNYGSEVFRVTRGFKAVDPHPLLVPSDLRAPMERAKATFRRVAHADPMSFCLFQQAPWFGHGRLAVEQSQVVLRTPYMDNDLVRLMYRGPGDMQERVALQRRLIEESNPTLLEIPTDRALRGRKSALAARWAYFKSYFAFKADYMYKAGMPQWLEQMHYLLGPLQPERRIIGCHRFTHFRIWFRGALARYVQEILLDPAVVRRPFLRADGLEEMVRRHLKGDRNYTSQIDKALTLELIQRQLIEGEGFGATTTEVSEAREQPARSAE